MNIEQDQIRLLAAMARRLRDDPRFMAHALAAYQEQKGLDDESLSRDLDALPEMLVRLALCERPEPDAPDFAERARALADYTLIDEARLVAVIRQSDGFAERPSLAGSLAGALARVCRGAGAFARHPVPALAGAIGLIIVIIAGVLVWQTGRETQSPDVARRDPEPVATSPNPTTPTPATAQVAKQPSPELIAQVRVRLADYPTLRDVAEAGRGEKKPIVLPASRARLVIELPERDAKGLYRASVVDADGETLKAAQERSTDGKTLAVILDLRGLSEKASHLSLGRVGEAPHFYPVVIGNPKKQ
jgi:hypothetical protein